MRNFSTLRLATVLVVSALLTFGCGSSDNFVSSGVGFGTPVAADDAYAALGNTTLTIDSADGVLQNDIVNGSAVTAFDNPTAQGGSVNVAADGSFVYNPPVGLVGTDTFAYTIAGPGGQSTATVTMTTSQLFWYVDNTSGGGDGTFATPFNTLVAAVNAAAVNETIFILAGDNTSTGLTGPVTLKAGQTLIGEAEGLDLDDFLPRQIVQPGVRPQLMGPITLADGVTLRGLRILPLATGSALVGGSISNLTLDNISAPGGQPIDIFAIELDGDCTITDSILGTGFFRITGSSVVNFTSRDNVWPSFGAGVAGSNTSTTTCSFTRDEASLQIDATDSATISATLSNCTGRPVFSSSVTAVATGQITNSSLADLDVAPNTATSSVNVSVTDSTLGTLSNSFNNGPIRIEMTRVVQVLPGTLWDLNGQGAGISWILTDCTVDQIRIIGQLTDCVRSTGGTYIDVDLDTVTIDDFPNFLTNNSVSGGFMTTNSVDGVCP
jgi:hypothetical protein